MSVDVVRRSLTLHGRRISYLTLAATTVKQNTREH